MGDLPTLQPNSPILLQKCLKTAKSAKNVRFAVILNTNLSTYSSYMIDKWKWLVSLAYSEMDKMGVELTSNPYQYKGFANYLT